VVIDFVYVFKFILDVMYFLVDGFVLVVGNLNACVVGVLYGVFCVEEACGLVSWFEWHYAFVYGGWLGVVEIGLGLCVVWCLGVCLGVWGDCLKTRFFVFLV
jgi:hypothetical protein